MSVGASVGGGKGQESTTSPSAMALTNLATGIMSGLSGASTGLLDAMKEVLTTGGSSVPLISKSVEATRRASSKTLAGTEEELAKKGMAGTPFGEMVRSQTALEGNIAAGQTQQSLAQAIFSMIPQFIMGQTQSALGGLAGAIPGLQTTKSKGKGAGVSGGFGG